MKFLQSLLWVALFLICGGVNFFALNGEAAAAEKPMWVYIGTYTGEKSKGIYVSRFDPSSGTLTAPELAAETKSPSFLAVHPNGRFLYAVGEVGDFGGKKSGAVTAFSIDKKSGRLTLLNQQPSE